MTYNILQAYKQQRQQKQKPEPKNCKDCIYSRFYDSEFNYQVIDKRCYCRKWLSIVRLGRAKHCPYYENNEEVR